MVVHHLNQLLLTLLFRKLIRFCLMQTAEVRFALEAYNAKRENTYVRFFNILRRASYLQASILLVFDGICSVCACRFPFFLADLIPA